MYINLGGNKMKTITIRLDEELFKDFKRLCIDMDSTMSKFITNNIKTVLKEVKND
jgi:predicted transcriptional regulator